MTFRLCRAGKSLFSGRVCLVAVNTALCPVCGFCVPGFWVRGATSCGARGHRNQALSVRLHEWLPNNVARNSLLTISTFEFMSLELQRFQGLSKTDRGKLRATFVWCPPSGPERWEAGVRVGPLTGSGNPSMRSWALLVERGRPRPRSTYRVNLRSEGAQVSTCPADGAPRANDAIPELSTSVRRSWN